MGFYSRHIAPGLVDFACSAKPIAYQRRKIIPQASGVVLEIGAGGGRNFALYDRTKVSHLIALEPEAGMIKRGRARVPVVAPVRELADWLPQAGAGHAAGLRLVLSLQPDAAALPALRWAGTDQVLTLSGPEGGLTPDEEAAARAAGFLPAALGPRVLRADTAPLALLAWLGLAALD